MFHQLVKEVLAEIAEALASVDEKRVSELVHSILEANRVVVHGAGRVGLACKGFAMRLGHLGKQAFTVSDSTVPPLGKEDLLILASSSGQTQTVYDVGVLAKTHGARLVVITADEESPMAKIADSILVLRAQTKFGPIKGVSSMQPMATQFEQCVQILFDVLILLLMHATKQSQADLWARHSNLD